MDPYLESDILEAIAAFNRSFLAFAQRMLTEDHAQVKHALGLSDSLAARIRSLSGPEIAQVAQREQVICQLREDAVVHAIGAGARR